MFVTLDQCVQSKDIGKKVLVTKNEFLPDIEIKTEVLIKMKTDVDVEDVHIKLSEDVIGDFFSLYAGLHIWAGERRISSDLSLSCRSQICRRSKMS